MLSKLLQLIEVNKSVNWYTIHCTEGDFRVDVVVMIKYSWYRTYVIVPISIYPLYWCCSITNTHTSVITQFISLINIFIFPHWTAYKKIMYYSRALLTIHTQAQTSIFKHRKIGQLFILIKKKETKEGKEVLTMLQTLSPLTVNGFLSIPVVHKGSIAIYILKPI